RTDAATRPRTDAAELRAARKDVTRLERQLDRLAERQATLERKLLDAGSDVARLIELDAELRAVVAEKEELELAWMAAAEVVENS
ncbi:MAG TPA: ABC transporter ATP-binding protein, partial [Pseudonocardiaceae bacterium]